MKNKLLVLLVSSFVLLAISPASLYSSGISTRNSEVSVTQDEFGGIGLESPTKSYLNDEFVTITNNFNSRTRFIIFLKNKTEIYNLRYQRQMSDKMVIILQPGESATIDIMANGRPSENVVPPYEKHEHPPTQVNGRPSENVVRYSVLSDNPTVYGTLIRSQTVEANSGRGK